VSEGLPRHATCRLISKPRSPIIFATAPAPNSSPRPPSKRATAASRRAPMWPPARSDRITSARSTPLHRHQGPRQGRWPWRACRSFHLRSPLLHIFGPNRYRPHGPGHTRSLGRREHASAVHLEFGDDLSPYQSGHGAKNMAVIRGFTLELVRSLGPKEVSRHDTSEQAGTPPSCQKSFKSRDVNLDSLLCYNAAGNQ
jgi:hypothetical protein